MLAHDPLDCRPKQHRHRGRCPTSPSSNYNEIYFRSFAPLLLVNVIILHSCSCVVGFESRRWQLPSSNGPRWGIRKDTTTSTKTTTPNLISKRRSPSDLFSSKQQQDLDSEEEEDTVESNARDTNSNNGKSNPRQFKRRDVILSSAAALLSSVFTADPTSPSSGVANAAMGTTKTTLEDSEIRRIQVFERNAPSVVFIDTFAEKQDVFSPNVMEVPLGTGSGFVYDKSGHVVTNYHVIRNAKFAQVALITPRTNKNGLLKLKGGTGNGSFVGASWNAKDKNNPTPLSSGGSIADDTNSMTSSSDVFSSSPSTLSGQSTRNRVSSTDYQRTVFKAKVVGTDPGKDIAVLKIDAPPELLYPIDLGTSSNLRVGQNALAIGNPFGLDHSLTVGVISGLGREVKSPIGRPINNVIQADCSINPGNSGGVLLDSSGKLIGMNTAIYSPSGASAGIGFAIPVDTVKYIADILIKDGKVVRPILGISFLESKQARALGIGKGVLVLDVPPDSPAAKAGLKGTRRTETGLVEIGDIIVKVGSTVIESEANLFSALETYKPGDEVSVVVVRIDAVNDQLTQRELTLKIRLQSSEILHQGQFLLRDGGE
mmetsp:Transcript_18688/g.45130  ORF Transcript_18688/g.45130 Transcript_18688/m.45130 type:complete len:599 (+) Transcript_18688:157-1953(+)